MIAKATLGAVAASLFVVLVPLAATAAALVLGVIAAVCWMSVVHGLLARLDGRDRADRSRLPVAERVPSGGGASGA